MKKSDAISVIGKVLVLGLQGFDNTKQERYKNLSLAEIVLEELLEVGMSPPSGKHQTSYDLAMGSLTEWEPEDET